MKEIKCTKNLFLGAMSAIYLFAFSSLYHQIPGLYGDSGILPVRAVIDLDTDATIIQKKATDIPSLLWMAPIIGLDAPTMMEFLSLIGIVVAFGALIWNRMREATNFALLWLLYFSLYQAGQTFMWFQWDILLLEAGFLTILVAPLGLFNRPSHGGVSNKAHDNITMWLVRWLLFRLMFASGVVKLTSQCPTWWTLSALTVHFESQCIPTSIAWFIHHMPVWFLKLGVVGTYVIEIAIPFLFFSPLRRLRLFSFKAQVLFQLMIILTGNYNFFNLLTLSLCISLLDDEYLGHTPPENKSPRPLNWTLSILTRATEAVVYGALVYWTISLFNLSLKPDWTVSSSVNFTPGQFSKALTNTLPVTICIGIISLGVNIINALFKSVCWPGSVLAKIFSILGTVATSAIAIYIFSISLVPHTVTDRTSANSLWPVLRLWHSRVDRFNIVSSYGLFRRMTGIGGRPEIVIEGSYTMESGWREYQFLYKPGPTSRMPPFILPHQARLDWQMWFAALGSYKDNPWLVSLIYRLLSGEPEVLALLDESSPFGTSPPMYIRAKLYTYKFTAFEVNKRMPKVNDWWTREKKEDYFPVVSRTHQSLQDYLKSAGIPIESQEYRLPDTYLKKTMLQIRKWVSLIKAPTFIWSIFCSAMTIKFLNLVIRI